MWKLYHTGRKNYTPAQNKQAPPYASTPTVSGYTIAYILHSIPICLFKTLIRNALLFIDTVCVLLNVLQERKCISNENGPCKIHLLDMMTTELERRHTSKLESDRHIKVESCQPGQKSGNEKMGNDR